MLLLPIVYVVVRSAKQFHLQCMLESLQRQWGWHSRQWSCAMTMERGIIISFSWQNCLQRQRVALNQHNRPASISSADASLNKIFSISPTSVHACKLRVLLRSIAVT